MAEDDNELVNNDEAPKITADLLLDLHRDAVTSATEAATVRNGYATRVKSLMQTHNLNGKAFKMASTIRKMENGNREHFYSDLIRYCELMNVNQQKNILDTISDNNAGRVRSDLDKVMDGEPVEAGADETGRVVKNEETPSQTESRLNGPLEAGTPTGNRMLTTFNEGIADITDRQQVAKALERFCEDHPKLAELAAAAAKARLKAIGEDQGGGEDLRGGTQRAAETQEADQAADTGKRTGRSRKKKTPETGSQAVH